MPDAGDDVIEAVRTNVDGNPLFLEERFWSLVETGALVKDETSWSISGSVTIDVPQALERLIRSRVDRLAPLPRETFVAASVLGPEFAHSALCAVTEMNEESSAAVGELCAHGLAQRGPSAARARLPIPARPYPGGDLSRPAQ